MSCLTLTVTPTPPAALAVPQAPSAELSVTPIAGAALVVTPKPGAVLAPPVAPKATLVVTPTAGATLTIGEVCGVSGGTIVVLAGADGPFRNRDGGYFLLDPALNPEEE